MLQQLLFVFVGTLLGGFLSAIDLERPMARVKNAIKVPSSQQVSKKNAVKATNSQQASRKRLDFLAFGGGGAPSYNEIALEKNILYFQRTLQAMGYDPKSAAIFFANGNDKRETVRYVDAQSVQKFKAPQIPHLKGAATLTNLQNWLKTTRSSGNNLFFYFTGHGLLHKQDNDNNSLVLWDEEPLYVQQFAGLLDRLPPQKSVTIVMAQCFSGSFANFIYERGDPQRPLSSQNRCGFFATIKTLPSVGCTPKVDESDYHDYSSSFFAGLSGRNRAGAAIASTDYNKDGRVSYAEAHAFAKTEKYTTDLPVSTSEVWLQQKSSRQTRYNIFSQSMNQLLQTARPEQRFAVNTFIQEFGLNPNSSFRRSQENIALDQTVLDTAEKRTYFGRLQLELINIGMENQIRSSGDRPNIDILNRLIKCESGSWQN